MNTPVRMPRTLLIAGLLVAGPLLGAAPAALAVPVPSPEPVPVPTPETASGAMGSSDCPAGQVRQDGNCLPAMTPLGDTTGAQPMPPAPMSPTGVQTSSTESGLPVNLVPNINGDPCTGYWESVACYAMNQDTPPAVVPRSTLSSSP